MPRRPADTVRHSPASSAASRRRSARSSSARLTPVGTCLRISARIFASACSRVVIRRPPSSSTRRITWLSPSTKCKLIVRNFRNWVPSAESRTGLIFCLFGRPGVLIPIRKRHLTISRIDILDPRVSLIVECSIGNSGSVGQRNLIRFARNRIAVLVV